MVMLKQLKDGINMPQQYKKKKKNQRTEWNKEVDSRYTNVI